MPRVASSNALAAPDCAGVELGRYLRRHTMTGTLDANDAQRAFETFRTLGLETYPTGPLLAEAFACERTSPSTTDCTSRSRGDSPSRWPPPTRGWLAPRRASESSSQRPSRNPELHDVVVRNDGGGQLVTGHT